MIKIAIVEDQEEVQDMLSEIVQLEKQFKLVGAYFDGKSAIKNIPFVRPDIVLMDIGLPDISGIECIKTLKPSCSKTEFMILSSFGDEANIFNALEAGASSYLLKTALPGFILQSIEELQKGGSPMSPEIARILVNRMFRRPEAAVKGITEQVTAREFEILDLLSKGHLYKEIAEHLQISVNTIKVHCYKIYQKLHVTNKVEAINKLFGNPTK